MDMIIGITCPVCNKMNIKYESVFTDIVCNKCKSIIPVHYVVMKYEKEPEHQHGWR